jgi:transaldolase/glucose-6-phosphate isomerase
MRAAGSLQSPIPVAAPSAYGNDRLFVYVRLEAAPDHAQDAAVDTLERAGRSYALQSMKPMTLVKNFSDGNLRPPWPGSIIGVHHGDAQIVVGIRAGRQTAPGSAER